jgi:hypothetical protein
VGVVVPLFGASNGGEQQKKLRDGLGLGHRRPPIKNFTHNNQPKTGGRNGGDYEGEVQQAGGTGEAQYHCFGEALQLNGGLKLK